MAATDSGIKIENNVLKGKEMSYRSEYTSLGHLVLDKLGKEADFVGQVDPVTDEKYTYRKMRERSVRCALWMKAQGLLPGDVVAICSPNQSDAIMPCFAALYLGVIFNPLEATMNARNFRQLLKIFGPKIAFASENSATAIVEAAKELKLDLKVVVFGKVPGFLEFESVIAEPTLDEVENFKMADIKSPDETAFVTCSSGTTGLPKGVALSHAALLRSMSNFKSPELNGATCMVFSSLYWFSGTYFAFMSLFSRMTNILAPPFEEYSACSYIEKYKVKWAMLAPNMIIRLVKSDALSKYDLSSLRIISTGGSPLASSSLDELAKFVPNAVIIMSYGMSECGGAIALMASKSKPGSCGRIAINFQMKVIDPDNGRILGSNQTGEICIKSPTMMNCYFNNPEATAETVDDEGWLHTGDLGYYDEEGEVFIVDRLRELIKYCNYQISPNEIENLISSHPGVREVAVVGVPHPEDGEHPVAFVVRSADQTDSDTKVTEKDLIELVATELTDTKRLRGGVKFLDSLPRSPSNKILRKVLRDLAKSMEEN